MSASMNGQIAPPAIPKYASTPIPSNQSAIASTTLIGFPRSDSLGPSSQHEQPRLGHLLDGVAEPLAAETRVLHSSERHVVDPVRRRVVDDNAADVQLLEGAPGVGEVVREEA